MPRLFRAGNRGIFIIRDVFVDNIKQIGYTDFGSR